MKAEMAVAGHYGKAGLEEKILAAMARAGVDPAQLTPAILAPMDEFHIGGLESTKELAAQMELRPGMKLLDVGCGIGGPARYFAKEHACDVTGIDLTKEFVEVARSLTRLLKLDSQARFEQGSALKLPFEAASFDGAYLIHVGMNLSDKAGVYREVRRVLKPGALFTIFDILRTGEGALQFPVPWATTAESSFVENEAAYHHALKEAGFQVEKQRDRREFAIAHTEERIAKMAKSGPPALALQVLMGEQAPLMIGNTLAMLKQGLLSPVEILARAV
jgi:ubiquinone/menaquinone biosynthesis C-methylase UbiE